MTHALIDRSRLDDALHALGIDPATVPDVFAPRETATEPKSAAAPYVALDDAEWDLIVPHLPAEPAQAATHCNRVVVEAVLWATALAKSWTQLGDERAEAIRKKFSRWSRAQVWQGLWAALSDSELSPERKQQLRRIAERAESQRRKSA